MSKLLTSLPNSVAIALSFAGLYVAYQLALVVYNLYFHPLSKFPGPPSRTGIHMGDYWHLLQGTHPKSVKELHDQYGDVVRIRPDALTFNTPGAWKDIYGSRTGKGGQLQKDERFYTVGSDNRENIVFCNDSDHSRMRKLLSHAFSDSALRQQEDILTKYFDLLVSGLSSRIDKSEDEKTNTIVVDMAKWYNFLTFDIIGDLCFGESFGALESGEYHVWMANLFGGIKYARFLSIAQGYQPLLAIMEGLIKMVPGIAKAKVEHEEFCFVKTQTRLDSKTERKDFMSYILRHNDERGMSNEEIKNISGLLIIAGSETTATLLSGVTFLLLKNSDAYTNVQAEVRGAFEKPEEMTLVTTSKLPYLQACLEEALRIYPPVPLALPRRTGKDGAIIDGVAVPGNTSVAVAQFATYHSPKNFTDPESFVPERWLPNPPAKYENDNQDAMNPFSTGPRNCIGKNLAYNEMRSVMARMIWHFDMELADKDFNWLDQPVYFMWEKNALNIKLTHRKI